MVVWLYNLFFAVGLPIALLAWSSRIDQLTTLAPAPLYLGSALTLFGGLFLMWSIFDFVKETGRIPSNAAPPTRRAINGPYRLLSDPIYTAAIALAFGIFALIGSGGGFWVVAPALLLGALALIFGKEAQDRPLLTAEERRSLLSLPEGSEQAPSSRQRASALLHLGMFVLIAELVRHAAKQPLTPPFSLLAQAAVLVIIALNPTWTRSVWRLRRLLIAWWTAAVGVVAVSMGPFPIVGPISAEYIYAAMALGALAGAHLMRAPLPALSLIGVCAVAAAYLPVDWKLALLVCLFAAGALPLHALLLRMSSAIANSWSAFSFGPLRIINYAVYAMTGAAIGTYVFVAAVGERGVLAALIIGVSVVLSAGLWGQLVEFSGKLARPFGYYGALIGAFVGVAIASLALGLSPWLLGVGLVLGAPAAQAVGRLRCLVQGCCHGSRVAYDPRGIVYTRPHSRVLRIAKLGHQHIHPTPLYSIYANAFAMLVLIRMTSAGASQTYVIGAYLFISGCLRFIEEGYRGEPQTPIWRGLKLYQWLAVVQALIGCAFTLIESGPVPALSTPSSLGIAVVIAVGAIAGIAMGVDFPRAKSRFSQLTPTEL